MSKKLDLDLNETQLIMFSTKWCPDCIMMKPIFNEVEEWINEEGYIIKTKIIDAEEYGLYKKIGSSFKVRKVPSFYLIYKGKKHFINYEYTPIEMFQNIIKEIVGK